MKEKLEPRYAITYSEKEDALAYRAVNISVKVNQQLPVSVHISGTAGWKVSSQW